ncbi:MAG: sugar phosphate nucleotidyltransferase [Alphaproteobacteria bacterium]|nr:sugar phosphate nucleotidyltransferase [Alphaproteobacteria bacterium]
MLDNLEFIIAAAGKSTRNYPHAKGLPHKCLLPIGDVRLIDIVLRDIVAAGGRHVTLVCGDQKTIDALREALAGDPDAESKLRARGHVRTADALKSTFLPADMDIKYAIQEKPLGTAQVLGLAHRLSPGRHGVLIFPDDIIESTGTGDTHLKRLCAAFLENERQILLTGIEKEDVSNNAIIHGGRLIEKPKIAYNKIGGYSPIVVCRDCLDFIERATAQIEKTGRMPRDLSVGEWVYVDGINAFLDSVPENAYTLKMFLKSPEDTLWDTGTLPLYERAQIHALLNRSAFAAENRRLARAILSED